MPKTERGWPDETDINILGYLYVKGQATASEIARELNIPRGTASTKLKKLVQMGYLSEPEVDISKDVLRKVYKRPDREIVYKAVRSYFENERFSEVIADLYTPEEFLETEITYERALKDDILDKLTDLRGEALKKLKEGISIEEVDEIFDKDYYLVVGAEMLGFVEVKDNKVKLTDEGHKEVLETWISIIKDWLDDLKAFDLEAYKEILSEYCRDIKDYQQ